MHFYFHWLLTRIAQSFLSSLSSSHCVAENREAADKLYEELCETYEEHLAVHTAMLAQLEGEGAREWPGNEKPLPVAVLQRLKDISDKVISSVDATELLAFLGTKSDQRPDATKIKQLVYFIKAIFQNSFMFVVNSLYG